MDIQYIKNSKIKINDSNNFNTIENNTLIVECMHYCYSHAIMDFIFPIYWLLKDINKINKCDKFNIFIKNPKHSINFKIIKNNKFVGVFNELINLLEPDKIIFEPNLKNNLLIKNGFYIESNGEFISNFQRGVWNCSKYYIERNVDINDVYFKDDIIYDNLKKFVTYVKKKLNISDYNTKNNMIIIERKDDRLFDKKKMNYILNSINNNIIFNGIKILENMTLTEQIDLFSKNNIFVFRHGSCLINLLWIQKNSIVIDLDDQINRKQIVSRICYLTNSKHYYLDYTETNCKHIKNILNF